MNLESNFPDVRSDDAKNGKMILVSSCDEGYFPLAKGLFQSLIDSNILGSFVRLGFVDLGCRPASLGWLRDHDVVIVPGTNAQMGELSNPRLGYHRAQTCRAFLPELFPDAEVLAWIDCDTWFQDASILNRLYLEALAYRDSMLACPEVHYTYTKINNEVHATHQELYRYYEALYGADVAEKLHVTPTVNSGFLVMHAESPLWTLWKTEIESIYLHNYDRFDAVTRHFAEQISLNMLLKTRAKVRYFDPAYNYLCLWNPPFRDEEGVVRMSLPPYAPVGMLHLAGGWRYFGRSYTERDLLYDGGNYLEDHEKIALLKAFGVVSVE